MSWVPHSVRMASFSFSLQIVEAERVDMTFGWLNGMMISGASQSTWVKGLAKILIPRLMKLIRLSADQLMCRGTLVKTSILPGYISPPINRLTSSQTPSCRAGVVPRARNISHSEETTTYF